MPKPVADAFGVLITVVLLLAAAGLLLAAIGTDHVVLAWGSVALSAAVAAMILARWRRSWQRRQDAPDDEPDLLLDGPVDVAASERPAGEQRQSASVTAVNEVDPVTASAEQSGPDDAHLDKTHRSEPELDDTELDDTEPGEEDTSAADLLIVYELTDEVLVIDEHPRYHLSRCRWPDHAHAERLPVREARELGFTPCERCRPDTVLARKHRAAAATTAGSN
ncbi:MAG: hypothetical protein ACRDRG_16320 [Pseudonocardiaceae bacterium]